MSEHFFGVGRGRAKYQRRIDGIARKHEATFTCIRDDSGAWRYWFACANLGHPFDKAVEDAVYADLEVAGLWPVPVHQ